MWKGPHDTVRGAIPHSQTHSPPLQLPDVVSGKKVSINDFKGNPATLVMVRAGG